MPTPAEQRALLFVAVVAALGIGFRGFRSLRTEPVAVSDRAALARQLANVDSLIAEGGRRRPSRTTRTERPPRPHPTRDNARPSPNASATRNAPSPATEPPPVGATIDMDHADASQLDRLPGIGPALAARIVADRELRGPFGSLEGLQRVRGVGPALALKVQPYVTFSLPPRPNQTEVYPSGGSRRP